MDEGHNSLWIAKISPDAPYKREGLLQEHQYKLLQQKVTEMIYG